MRPRRQLGLGDGERARGVPTWSLVVVSEFRSRCHVDRVGVVRKRLQQRGDEQVDDQVLPMSTTNTVAAAPPPDDVAYKGTALITELTSIGIPGTRLSARSRRSARTERMTL